MHAYSQPMPSEQALPVLVCYAYVVGSSSHSQQRVPHCKLIAQRVPKVQYVQNGKDCSLGRAVSIKVRWVCLPPSIERQIGRHFVRFDACFIALG